MTNEENIIGSIHGKPNIHDTYMKYYRTINGVGLVHFRGALKYSWYSWITMPETADALPMYNLNAIYRHLTAHSMGKLVDDEGLPHILHACCRMSMTLNFLAFYPNIKGFGLCKLTDDNPNKYEVLTQILPATLIVLSKNKKTDALKTMELFANILNMLDTDSNTWKVDIEHIDKLTAIENLAIDIFNYAEKELKNKTIQKYLKTLINEKNFPNVNRLIID